MLATRKSNASGPFPRSYEILLCDSVSFLRNTFLMQSIRALGNGHVSSNGREESLVRVFFFWMLHSDPCTPVKRLWAILAYPGVPSKTNAFWKLTTEQNSIVTLQ